MAPLIIWREVTAAELRDGRRPRRRGQKGRPARWWDLTLACGHKAVRTARYRPLPEAEVRRGGYQSRDPGDVLPPARQVKCEPCGKNVNSLDTSQATS
jgi:hypothetical protein